MKDREEEIARSTETAHSRQLARPRAVSRRDGMPRSARGVEFVEFLDATYRRWRVAERDARADPGARGDTCLIFACDDAVRRVWEYPAEWRELTAEALVALSWCR